LYQRLVAAQNHNEAPQAAGAAQKRSHDQLLERLFQIDWMAFPFNTDDAAYDLLCADWRIAAGQGIAAGYEMAMGNAPHSMDCELFLLAKQDNLPRKKFIYA
jgi:hypothetical protein